MIRCQIRFALAGIALAAILLAGCAKKPPEAVPGPVRPAPKSAEPAAKIRIVYIPKQTGNPYFDSIIAGFKKAQEELGFDFETVGPAVGDATSQIPFIQQQTQKRVEALAVSANSPDAIKPALMEAMKAGIKVITVNSDITGNEDGREAAVLPMDFNLTGESQIALMSELLGGRGEFAILSATTDAPDQNFWIKGMKAAMKDPKYRNLNLVEIVYGNDDQQKSMREAESLLTKHPNLKGILAPTSVGITAAAQVIETQKKADRVAVTGLGTPNQLRKYILNGTIKKFALWNPVDEGYIAGYLLNGMAAGKIEPAPDGSFEAGTLKERKFGDKNIVITGPPLIFDKSNIDQFNF